MVRVKVPCDVARRIRKRKSTDKDGNPVALPPLQPGDDINEGIQEPVPGIVADPHARRKMLVEETKQLAGDVVEGGKWGGIVGGVVGCLGGAVAGMVGGPAAAAVGCVTNAVAGAQSGALYGATAGGIMGGAQMAAEQIAYDPNDPTAAEDVGKIVRNFTEAGVYVGGAAGGYLGGKRALAKKGIGSEQLTRGATAGRNAARRVGQSARRTALSAVETTRDAIRRGKRVVNQNSEVLWELGDTAMNHEFIGQKMKGAKFAYDMGKKTHELFGRTGRIKRATARWDMENPPRARRSSNVFPTTTTKKISRRRTSVPNIKIDAVKETPQQRLQRIQTATAEWDRTNVPTGRRGSLPTSTPTSRFRRRRQSLPNVKLRPFRTNTMPNTDVVMEEYAKTPSPVDTEMRDVRPVSPVKSPPVASTSTAKPKPSTKVTKVKPPAEASTSTAKPKPRAKVAKVKTPNIVETTKATPKAKKGKTKVKVKKVKKVKPSRIKTKNEEIELTDLKQKKPMTPVSPPPGAGSAIEMSEFAVKSPVRSPVPSPVKSPVHSPVKSPVPSPVKSPVRSPVKSSTKKRGAIPPPIKTKDIEMTEAPRTASYKVDKSGIIKAVGQDEIEKTMKDTKNVNFEYSAPTSTRSKTVTLAHRRMARKQFGKKVEKVKARPKSVSARQPPTIPLPSSPMSVGSPQSPFSGARTVSGPPSPLSPRSATSSARTITRAPSPRSPLSSYASSASSISPPPTPTSTPRPRAKSEPAIFDRINPLHRKPEEPVWVPHKKRKLEPTPIVNVKEGVGLRGRSWKAKDNTVELAAKEYEQLRKQHPSERVFFDQKRWQKLRSELAPGESIEEALNKFTKSNQPTLPDHVKWIETLLKKWEETRAKLNSGILDGQERQAMRSNIQYYERLIREWYKKHVGKPK